MAIKTLNDVLETVADLASSYLDTVKHEYDSEENKFVIVDGVFEEMTEEEVADFINDGRKAVQHIMNLLSADNKLKEMENGTSNSEDS